MISDIWHDGFKAFIPVLDKVVSLANFHPIQTRVHLRDQIWYKALAGTSHTFGYEYPFGLRHVNPVLTTEGHTSQAQDFLKKHFSIPPPKRFNYTMKLSDGSDLGMSTESIAEPGNTLMPCPEGAIWYQQIRVWRGGSGIPPKMTQAWQQGPLPGNTEEVKRYIALVRKYKNDALWTGVYLSELDRRHFRFPQDDWSNLEAWLRSEPVQNKLHEALVLCRRQHDANIKAPTPQLPMSILKHYPAMFWPYLVLLPDGTIGVTELSAVVNPAAKEMFQKWVFDQEKLPSN